MRRWLTAGVCMVVGLLVCAQSPAHEALKKEIAELRKKPVVCELPPYLPADEDFDAVCQKAGREKKKVFVSIGREVCGRCQRFYELVRRGEVRIDTNAFMFVRLNIDDFSQREYFLGTVEPPDNRLPFVGVTDGERSEIRPCLTGAPSAAEYQELMKTK